MIWNKWSWLGCGFLLGSAGLKALKSDDAKKVYTHVTAAAMRCRDDAVEQYHLLRENISDIAADAEEINRKRYEAKEAQRIEDAKAVLAAAETK